MTLTFNSSQNKATIHLGSLENLKYKYCIGFVIDNFKAKEKSVSDSWKSLCNLLFALHSFCIS